MKNKNLSLWYARKLNDYYLRLKKEYKGDPEKVLREIHKAPNHTLNLMMEEARKP